MICIHWVHSRILERTISRNSDVKLWFVGDMRFHLSLTTSDSVSLITQNPIAPQVLPSRRILRYIPHRPSYSIRPHLSRVHDNLVDDFCVFQLNPIQSSLLRTQICQLDSGQRSGEISCSWGDVQLRSARWYELGSPEWGDRYSKVFGAIDLSYAASVEGVVSLPWKRAIHLLTDIVMPLSWNQCNIPCKTFCNRWM